MSDLNQQDDINEVIDKFRFERVYITMQALDWKWRDGGKSFIPTIAQLKQKARELLEQSIKTKVVSSGGFIAKYHPKADRDPEYFELFFVLEEVDSFIE